MEAILIITHYAKCANKMYRHGRDSEVGFIVDCLAYPWLYYKCTYHSNNNATCCMKTVDLAMWLCFLNPQVTHLVLSVPALSYFYLPSNIYDSHGKKVPIKLWRIFFSWELFQWFLQLCQMKWMEHILHMIVFYFVAIKNVLWIINIFYGLKIQLLHNWKR